MKKVKHWLHALLSVVTCGLWLPVYVIVIATTEMFNRGYRVGKAAGRVEKSNEYEAERLQPKFEWRSPMDDMRNPPNCRCIVKPIVDFNEPQVGADGKIHGYAPAQTRGVSTFDRFKELGDRMLSGDPLDSYEQLEYQQLRKEVVR